jgi:hypothetical protein
MAKILQVRSMALLRIFTCLTAVIIITSMHHSLAFLLSLIFQKTFQHHSLSVSAVFVLALNISCFAQSASYAQSSISVMAINV